LFTLREYMKNKSFFLFLFLLVFVSCKDNVDEIVFHKLDKYRWQYELPKLTNFVDLMPAVDSLGNIYIVQERKGKSSILQLSNDGMKKGLFDEGGKIDARPVVKAGKLYYHTSNNKLYCRNIDDGSFSFQIASLCNTKVFLLGENRLYFCSKGIDNSFLYAYSLSGILKWKKKLIDDGGGELTVIQMSMAENNIYIGAQRENGDFVLQKFILNGILPVTAWTWEAPVSYQGDMLKELAIDDMGSVYVGLNNGTTSKIFAISPEGSTLWSVATNKNNIENITLDKAGNCYIADSVCSRIKDGAIQWKSKGDHRLKYVSHKASGPVILSDNSISFIDENRILTNVSANDSINWNQFINAHIVSKDERFQKIFFNHNGEVLVSTNKRLMAFDGGNIVFDEQIWPKLYYDMGNTACRQ